jgi:hypothetical protein
MSRGWQARWAALLLLLGSSVWAADREAVDANRLKAAFLYNFSQFIEWPEASFAGADSPFVICVPGTGAAAGSFSAALEPLEKRKHKGRAIVIQRPGTVAEARKCQIIYLTDAKFALADGRPLLAQLGDAPILTVSEARDLAVNGAGIGFVEQDGKLRLVIDLGLLRPIKLRPSAKLLEIALAVNGG